MANVEGADGHLPPRQKRVSPSFVSTAIALSDCSQPSFTPQNGCLLLGGSLMKMVRILLFVAIAATFIFSDVGLVHSQAKKLNAVATITIIQDIAKNVAGDKINVDFLVPTDGDVHAYEPTPEDVKKIADADLILVNGVGLEQFLD